MRLSISLDRENGFQIRFARTPQSSDDATIAEWKRRASEYKRIISVFEKIDNEMRARVVS